MSKQQEDVVKVGDKIRFAVPLLRQLRRERNADMRVERIERLDDGVLILHLFRPEPSERTP